MEEIRECTNCSESKPLSCYYKTYGYHIKMCSKCHNKRRKKYAFNTQPKTKKVLGFKKLAPEIRESIIRDINANFTLREIHRGCGDGLFSYHTLVMWRNTGQLVY
jgi:hypothetical protein